MINDPSLDRKTRRPAYPRSTCIRRGGETRDCSSRVPTQETSSRYTISKVFGQLSTTVQCPTSGYTLALNNSLYSTPTTTSTPSCQFETLTRWISSRREHTTLGRAHTNWVGLGQYLSGWLAKKGPKPRTRGRPNLAHTPSKISSHSPLPVGGGLQC